MPKSKVIMLSICSLFIGLAGTHAARLTATSAAAPQVQLAATPRRTTTATPRRTATATPQPSPTPGPVVVATGAFHHVEEKGHGTATVFRQPDGTYTLHFTDFAVDYGPDLRVYLSPLNDANDSASVRAAGVLNLGGLKARSGAQTYNLPKDFDPQTYHSVVIWCRAFRLNMITAPLR